MTHLSRVCRFRLSSSLALAHRLRIERMCWWFLIITDRQFCVKGTSDLSELTHPVAAACGWRRGQAGCWCPSGRWPGPGSGGRPGPSPAALSPDDNDDDSDNDDNDLVITFFLASSSRCSSPDSLSPRPPISFILLSLPPSTQLLMFSSRLDSSPESSCSRDL